VTFDALVRDALEVAVVVAVGGMLVSVLRRLRRGELPLVTCPRCERPTTRANGICKHCAAPLA